MNNKDEISLNGLCFIVYVVSHLLLIHVTIETSTERKIVEISIAWSLLGFEYKEVDRFIYLGIHINFHSPDNR